MIGFANAAPAQEPLVDSTTVWCNMAVFQIQSLLPESSVAAFIRSDFPVVYSVCNHSEHKSGESSISTSFGLKRIGPEALDQYKRLYVFLGPSKLFIRFTAHASVNETLSNKPVMIGTGITYPPQDRRSL